MYFSFDKYENYQQFRNAKDYYSLYKWNNFGTDQASSNRAFAKKYLFYGSVSDRQIDDPVYVNTQYSYTSISSTYYAYLMKDNTGKIFYLNNLQSFIIMHDTFTYSPPVKYGPINIGFNDGTSNLNILSNPTRTFDGCYGGIYHHGISWDLSAMYDVSDNRIQNCKTLYVDFPKVMGDNDETPVLYDIYYRISELDSVNGSGCYMGTENYTISEVEGGRKYRITCTPKGKVSSVLLSHMDTYFGWNTDTPYPAPEIIFRWA